MKVGEKLMLFFVFVWMGGQIGGANPSDILYPLIFTAAMGYYFDAHKLSWQYIKSLFKPKELSNV